MLRSVLAELHAVAMSPPIRDRLVAIHETVRAELTAVLPPSLVDELHDLGGSPQSPAPSLDELRVAHAQLLGWISGLVAGLATGRDSRPT